MLDAKIVETYINLREATTRYMNFTCTVDDTGAPFDFGGYIVQTWVEFGGVGQYIPTTIVENLLSYKIPAELSKGKKRGVAETRIFKDGDVFEVMRVNITVFSADKPDTEPVSVNE